jgi:hypothetical protein
MVKVYANKLSQNPETKLFELPLMVASNGAEQRVLEGNLKLLATIGIIVGPDATNYKRLKDNNRNAAKLAI